MIRTAIGKRNREKYGFMRMGMTCTPSSSHPHRKITRVPAGTGDGGQGDCMLTASSRKVAPQPPIAGKMPGKCGGMGAWAHGGREFLLRSNGTNRPLPLRCDCRGNMRAKHADRNRESVCPFSPSSNSKQILLAGASGLFGRCSPVERVRNTNHSSEELGRGAGLGKGLQPRDAFAE